MSVAAPARFERSPLGNPLLLTALGLALAIAVVVLPASVATVWPGSGGQTLPALREALPPAFVQFWAADASTPGAELATVVGYWQGFHAVKAAAAGALLLVVILLGVRVWGAYARTEHGGRRLALAAGGIVGAPLGLLALLILVANIQGAIAPLSSVLTFLPTDGSNPAVAATVTQLRESLESGAPTAAASALVNDFRAYHVALVVCALAVTVGLLVASVILWMRRARTPRPERRLRRVHATFATLFPVLALAFGVLALANLSTALDPAPALLAYFAGGGV